MNRIEFGDCRETMRRWAAEGIKAQMCVTSPPYFGLRDYGHEGQIGLEQTPEEYISAMVEVFRCVRDVLADDGTLWLNIGDSYASNGGDLNKRKPGFSITGHAGLVKNGGAKPGNRTAPDGFKPKDLIGIPWMLAFALRADGWYLRQDIIWHKPNPMPESVRDRCTKAHEYLFLLSKSDRYFFDHEAIKTPVKEDWGSRDRSNGKYHKEGTGLSPHAGLEKSYATANKRSVWTVATRPYKGAHFATFPPSLIEPCILAGTSERGHCPDCGARFTRSVERVPMEIEKTGRNDERGTRTGTSGTMVSPPCCITTGWQAGCDCGKDPVPDIVLDPFMGSGTTAAVAIQHNRQYLGCELNPEYAPLQDQRITEANQQKPDDRQIDLFGVAA